MAATRFDAGYSNPWPKPLRLPNDVNSSWSRSGAGSILRRWSSVFHPIFSFLVEGSIRTVEL